jgi:poly [ADP-ribose] polymerase
MHVVDDGKVVWNVMLNQTNIGNNNNKFYVIQMLQDDVNTSKYYCFTRWARVGLVGQFNLDEFNSIEGAKKAFEGKFRDKTKNQWSAICAGAEFKTAPGKYTLIEIDHTADADDARPPAKKARKGASDDNDDDDDDDGGAVTGGGGLKRANSSKLPASVQKLVEIIFDLKMMEAQMTELEYDITKQPLGRLSKGTIKSGYTVLKELENAIKGGDGDIEALTNRFYTLIPHVFGMKRPPLIKTLDQVRAKLAMIEALADIEVASTLLKASKGAGSMIDANYEKLNCHIEPVARTSAEFKTVQEYVDNTFKGKPPKIVEVFALERDGEQNRFADVGAALGNRKLLWHGSRLTNFVGILSQGLRIAPPEAPVSGYRYGKGVYFADQASLSVNYCRTYGSPNFCMLLADVALGTPAELTADQYMEKPLAKTNSTLAVGSWVPSNEKKFELRKPKLPSNSKAAKIDHSVDVPLGKPVTKTVKTACYENQYIVYDVGQAKLQYLILFEQ